MVVCPSMKAFYDPLAGYESETQSVKTESQKPRKPMIEFMRPSEIASYVTPENHFLIGDALIQRGALTIFAGPGGVGKSRAVFGLAVAAARNETTWMGFPIHYGFKTLVVQSENGLPRLAKDFKTLGDPVSLDGRMLVSTPPEGMSMKNPEFRAALSRAVEDFQPDLIVFDPLNSMVSDSQERDIIELLGYLREIAFSADTNPAMLVVHHLRKPREGDKHKGRSMANLLAGSYVITSSARAVMTLQAASDDEVDPHAVLTVAKNNDGIMAPRSAWRRIEGGFFEASDDFDWEAFDGQSGPMAKIREEHIFALFDFGRRSMILANAARELMKITDTKRTAAYDALKPNGRFGDLIVEDLTGGVLSLSESAVKKLKGGDD